MQQEESIDVAGGKIPTSLRLSPGLRIIQMSLGLIFCLWFQGIMDGSDCEGCV